jgi:hypothetical protein
MKKLLLAAAILAASTTCVRAQTVHEWYFVNQETATCNPGAMWGGLSPQEAREIIRERGHIDRVEVSRFADGTVKSVAVYDVNKESVITFFTTWRDCQEALTTQRQAGTLPNPSELQ